MKPDKPCAPKKGRKASGEPPTPPMDEQIWKDFPEELMESVLARLPIPTLFRFTLVCKKWHSLFDSPTFLQLSEQVAQQNQPWLFATYSGMAALYDPCMNKWHYDFPFPSFSAVCPPLCAAGGLVCYPDYGIRSFLVGNPLTQTWRSFPWSTTRSTLRGTGCYAVGMAINPNQDYSPRGCKIVWVDTQGQFEVYDFSTGSIRLGRVPANIKLPSVLGRYSTVVSIGTVVYLLCSKPDGIISYDVVSGAWEQFQVPAPSNRSKHVLAECGGRLLLVGFAKNTTSVCVWELQTKTKTLVEVDKIPNSWCSEFTFEATLLRCYGGKRLLVITLVMLLTPRKEQFFTYDMVTREWSNGPGFDPPTQSYGCRLLGGVGFFTSLSVKP